MVPTHFPYTIRVMELNSSDLDVDLVVQEYPAPVRSLRVAFVTETYPPEVNGVAMTLAHLVQGLHARNHDVQLIRPRQPGAGASGTSERFHEVLMRGLPVPRYPSLRMGVPSKRALVRLWSFHRPDIVHIAFYRGQQDFRRIADGFFTGFNKRLEPGDRFFHHAGALDHLGQKHLAAAKQVAHHIHTGHQGTFDHRQRFAVFQAGFFGIGINKLGNALY